MAMPLEGNLNQRMELQPFPSRSFLGVGPAQAAASTVSQHQAPFSLASSSSSLMDANGNHA